MIRKSFIICSILILSLTVQAAAQEDTIRRIEVIPYGGYMWATGMNVLYGGQNATLDVESSPMWGVAIDWDLMKRATQLEVMYTRQQSEFNFKLQGEKTFLSDVSIDYVHLAMILGADETKRFWYTSLSLGATHIGFADDAVNDSWKFSIGFGLGMKHYFGKRFLFRLQGRAPYTIIGDGYEYTCNEGGCLKSAGGRGMWQYELSAGLGIVF
jgi:hypothetical protein